MRIRNTEGNCSGAFFRLKAPTGVAVASSTGDKALAVGRWIEAQTGWSIRKFVKTARRYRTIQIQAGRQAITAADPIPDDLRQILEAITRSSRGAH